MQSSTHISSSISLATIPFFLQPHLITSIEYVPYFLGGVAIGSLFPDIDEPNSSIGRKTLLLSWFLKRIFGHRGITHRFIFFLVPLLLTIIFENEINNKFAFVFMISFCFGMFFHHIGDMLSGGDYFKGGIKDYFAPFITNDKYFTPFPKIFRCAVGDDKEKIYNILFLSSFVYEVFYIIKSQNIIQF